MIGNPVAGREHPGLPMNAGLRPPTAPLRITCIDDDEEEFLLLSHMLSNLHDFPVELTWIGTFEAGVAALSQNAADIFLIDYCLGARTGLDLLLEARRIGSSRPALLLTGQGNREIDLHAAALGAADYLEKGSLTAAMLERSVRYALRQWMMMTAQKESNRELMRVQDQLEAEKVALARTASELAAARNVCDAQRQQMERLAMTDALTGISNRRHFTEMANREVGRARRYGHPLSVLSFDIDNFKGINDSLGHATGDDMLRRVAETVDAELRGSDVFARIGGDEFVVLSPQTDLPAASRIAERLRSAVKRMIVPANPHDLKLTVSIGIAAWRRSDGLIDATLARADEALYRAKKAGRDRACAFPDAVDSSAAVVSVRSVTG